MKFTTSTAVLVMVGVASARPDAVRMVRREVSQDSRRSSPKLRREVPQEHSHEQFLTGVGEALNLNNVENVQDPVFALLGNAAAAAGAGDVEDLDCLQQHVADQAFTNAKEAGDIEGMTNALIFRALVRIPIPIYTKASQSVKAFLLTLQRNETLAPLAWPLFSAPRLL
ncbi:hypothetical protein NPX13_g10793 [Xylaria arbuscula]|uniref:Uncharacterized protein n=1 Tax=Xylaria arbuscula TaxID=114810 RepID=A0A9W8N428_9PEZI|nr:hypothetical protein NPX13_g10793 [Xylaria arbuscula]